ncbi:MAG: HAMP domain-containing protein, partial [Anaerolineae bacterium]|nr:HAMP domain-containing protein [Anaerolineae bacterium]
MSIRTRAFLLFGFIGLLAAVLAGSALFTNRAVRDQFEHLNQDVLPSAVVLLHLESEMTALVADVEYDLVSGDIEEWAENAERIENLGNLIADYNQIESSPANERARAIVLLLENDLQLVLSSAERIQAAVTRDADEEIVRSLRLQMHQNLNKMNGRLQGELDAHLNDLDSSTLIVRQSIDQGNSTAIMIMVFTAVAGTTAIFFFVRNMIGVLGRMHKGAVRMSQGDFSQRLNIQRRDEVGQLAGAFDQMADTIQGQMVQMNELNGSLKTSLEEAEKAREQAERSDKVKSAFLASMSHELRTPLNAVINFTRFVVDGDTGPVNEQQIELLTDVINSARHLLNLINDVLDMSKIEAGSLNLFIEDHVDLNGIIDTVMSTGRSLLLDKPVQL